ncbi:hypothetical protein Sru01_08070 [Sphaerisporangium rufum]|uniref:Chitin-binding type-4 domain-containing protein n=1 Tax=Sphaerisporangium rufum TaxID=1381558 RepID=A0A919V311_9ACTN|nr:lytic polysaccharide monooxygenase [Sphaerisporangium rufum]GII75825.1 hypothetical protein Sru01_08070 [Sphaerisporangium rufum]
MKPLRAGTVAAVLAASLATALATPAAGSLAASATGSLAASAAGTPPAAWGATWSAARPVAMPATAAARPAAAAAHGALTSPVSRAAACGPQGGAAARSRACRAAVADSEPGALAGWDELRVPGVAGRDRRRIPDGRLCSAGLARFRGLDLARDDWPATELRAGARFAFRYRATIPHKGTFRMYLTRSGWPADRPLTWAALEPRPFLTVTDPPLAGGAYRMSGRLPAGRTGRQVIYTVWQNSDTPDTYYSCSDVVFTAARAAPGDRPAATGTPGKGTPDSGSSGTGTPGKGTPDTGSSDDGTPGKGTAGDDTGPAPGAPLGATAVAGRTAGAGGTAAPLLIGGAVLLAGAGVLVTLARRADRRGRRARRH